MNRVKIRKVPTIDEIERFSEKKMGRLVEKIMSSDSYKLVEKRTIEDCYSREWCREHKVDYNNITNGDYYGIMIHEFYNLMSESKLELNKNQQN